MSEATLTQSTAKGEIGGGFKMAGQLLSKDIGAMSDEVLAKCPGEKARCGFDLIFELASVNRMIAALLRGESSNVPPPSGWIRSPEDYRSKEAAQADLASSVTDLVTAFEAVPEAQLGQEIDTPFGRMTIAKLMVIMGGHMMYHSGQLNYIQTLHGDDSFHWLEA